MGFSTSYHEAKNEAALNKAIYKCQLNFFFTFSTRRVEVPDLEFIVRAGSNNPGLIKVDTVDLSTTVQGMVAAVAVTKKKIRSQL